MTIQKQSLPVFLDEKGEPKAVVFYSQDRKRIVYTVREADEDEIVELFEHKEKTIDNG